MPSKIWLEPVFDMADYISSLFIFVLAMFAGIEVIRRVPPTLHTPLMSGANAISGVILIGAVIVAGRGGGGVIAAVGFIAVVMATINVVGGFMVTDRMLKMFKKKEGIG